MSKIRIRIVILGYLPHSIDLDKVKKWDSDLFEIITPISLFNLIGNSDGTNWEYYDTTIENQLPERDEADVLLSVTNIPIECGYFARRFSDNRVCMTYNTMAEILKFDNIPFENLLLRILYSISFVYKSFGNRIPLMTENTNFTHDETRGCIFDMNGIKTDVIYSLNKPQLCNSCIETLLSNPKHRVERDLINKVQKELKLIKKGRYFQISDFVKTKPILAIFLSSLFALVLGVFGSLIASILWKQLGH